jgi:hypothetical protein
MEIGNMASTKLRVSMFNINNAAKSSSSKTGDSEEGCEMKSVDEFELALRTMRCAAHFSVNWNYSFVALENFLWNRKFCKEELKFDPESGAHLVPICGFCVERELKPLERRRELPHNWGVDRLLGQLYRGEAPREKPALPAPVCWSIQQEQPEQPEAAEEEVSSQRHLPQMECGQV